MTITSERIEETVADVSELARRWRRVKFGDVVRQIKSDVKPEESGLERYVAGEHMETDDLHIRRWGIVGDGYLGPAFHRKFVKGQVLYGSRRTYLRKVAVAEFDGICANTTFVLEPADDQLLPELLPFIMQTDAFNTHSIKQSKGSVNPYVNFSDLAWYEFALPPIDEQQRIADILWAAEHATECWRDVTEHLASVRLAVRNWLFGNMSTWQQSTVGELFEIQLGKMLSPKAKSGNSPTPYLGNSNVQWDRFDLSDVQTMDFDEDERQKFELRIGDLLVCEGGEVGRAAIWQGQIEGCCYQKALHRLRSRSGILQPELMLQYLAFAAARNALDQLVGHSTIAHLTAVKLASLHVPVPPVSVQSRAIETFRKLKVAIHNSQEKLIRTRQLKSGLIHSLLERSSYV